VFTFRPAELQYPSGSHTHTTPLHLWLLSTCG